MSLSTQRSGRLVDGAEVTLDEVDVLADNRSCRGSTIEAGTLARVVANDDTGSLDPDDRLPGDHRVPVVGANPEM